MDVSLYHGHGMEGLKMLMRWPDVYDLITLMVQIQVGER